MSGISLVLNIIDGQLCYLTLQRHQIVSRSGRPPAMTGVNIPHGNLTLELIQIFRQCAFSVIAGPRWNIGGRNNLMPHTIFLAQGWNLLVQHY
jgi:hypothetical protein